MCCRGSYSSFYIMKNTKHNSKEEIHFKTWHERTSLLTDPWCTLICFSLQALSLNYYFLSQWCHSNFQTQARKVLIPYLWSAATSGGFLQLLSKHQLSQSLQTSPSLVKLQHGEIAVNQHQQLRCTRTKQLGFVGDTFPPPLCWRPSPHPQPAVLKGFLNCELAGGGKEIIVGISLQK